MPKTYEQEFNDLQQANIYAEFSRKKEEILLNEKPFYSRNDINRLKKVIKQLKRNQIFIFFSGLSLGAIIAIVIIHYSN